MLKKIFCLVVLLYCPFGIFANSCFSLFNNRDSSNWEQSVLKSFDAAKKIQGPRLSKESWQKLFESITGGRYTEQERLTFQAAIELKDLFTSRLVHELVANEFRSRGFADNRKKLLDSLARLEDAPLEQQMEIIDGVVERLIYILGHGGRLENQDRLNTDLKALGVSEKNYRELQWVWNRYKDVNFFPIRLALLMKIQSESEFRKNIADSMTLWRRFLSRVNGTQERIKLSKIRRRDIDPIKLVLGKDLVFAEEEFKAFIENLLPISLIRFLEYNGQFLSFEQIKMSMELVSKYHLEDSQIFIALKERLEVLADILVAQDQIEHFDRVYFNGSEKGEMLLREKIKLESYLVGRSQVPMQNLELALKELEHLMRYPTALETTNGIVRVLGNFVGVDSKSFTTLALSALSLISRYSGALRANEGIEYIRQYSLSIKLSEQDKVRIKTTVLDLVKRYSTVKSTEKGLALVNSEWGLNVKTLTDKLSNIEEELQALKNEAQIDNDSIREVGDRLKYLLEEHGKFTPLMDFGAIDQKFYIEDIEAKYLQAGKAARKEAKDASIGTDRSNLNPSVQKALDAESAGENQKLSEIKTDLSLNE